MSYTCRCAHMQVEDLLVMVARLRVFKLPNFEARGKHALWILVEHKSSYRTQEADVAGLLPRQGSLLTSVTKGFVCVEVLRPSQPHTVMSSTVSLPNHTFTGQA